ncbi:doublesex- and mab-3-related transcription factor B1-like [Cyclopterus lumpus]|uniref:doublesex- and mab-3-related transcription factor B1-like n=1 Tax=Cyclopterus lumpus TaxID=8103 RepID=UPI001486B74C|nr:doublesex- and mab-3-related transcription factor B1-like [Cyclopterus lumpus]
MSLSKEQLTIGASEHLRKPKCTRCRHHGIIIPQKGHIRYCPFLKCDCCKCYLLTQRTRLTALQRSLKKAPHDPQRKEQRPAVSTVTVAAEGTCSTVAREDDAGLSAAFGVQGPPTKGAPGRAAATGPSRHDVHCQTSAGRQTSAGLDGGKVAPFAFSEEGPGTRFSAPSFGELGQAAPLPVLHVPWMSGYPSGYGPCPNLLLNMPWLPPVPTGLYNNGLHGPLMFPHFEPAALHYPPPPEPGPAADCRPVFFTLQPLPLPEPPQEELLSWQHSPSPPCKHTEPDVEELD